MSLENKKFRNNKTGEVVKVISAFENIAVLENKQKTTVSDLMNPSIYTEEIDPSSFFSNQSAYNILAEKIKTIPTHMIKDDETNPVVNLNPTYNSNMQFSPTVNESAIVMTTEEDERAELARKYGVTEDSTQSLQRQNEAFARILGEDSDNELPQIPVRQFDETPVQRVEVNREEMNVVNQISPQNSQQINNQTVQQIEDPIITMFKRTKRSVDFKVNVDISDKIPRLDFIEMMEDSYEVSMIDYLAEEFTNKILNDPSLIKESIKSKIKQLVYGGDVKFQPPINSQITDAVTQIEKHEPLSHEKEPVLSKDLPKKTTTRKPRAKKEPIQK